MCVIVPKALRYLGVERVHQVLQRTAERLQERVRLTGSDVTGGPEVVVGWNGRRGNVKEGLVSPDVTSLADRKSLLGGTRGGDTSKKNSCDRK